MILIFEGSILNEIEKKIDTPSTCNMNIKNKCTMFYCKRVRLLLNELIKLRDLEINQTNENRIKWLKTALRNEQRKLAFEKSVAQSKNISNMFEIDKNKFWKLIKKKTK